jgi:hypothetical protein
MATFRPPADHLDQLRNPLGAAEREVLGALRRLPDEWTVYVRARVGFDVPDFLAVHPHAGVCAFLVRDWHPGDHRLVDGHLERRHDDGRWGRSTDHPRAQAARVRSAVYDQFFALPSDATEPTETVRAVVVVPALSNQEVVELLGHPTIPPAERRIAVWGGEGLVDRLDQVVHGQGCAHPSPTSLARLHQHVVASEVPDPLPTPVRLGADARRIALVPGQVRVRRVRGPAGSGKTFGLAARAARLAADGREVLVLSFSVVLANRLRVLAADRCCELGADPTLVTCSNFHSFCTRVVDDAELAGIETVAPERMPWPEAIVVKATQVFDAGFSRRYDAVLIDEGQDFTREWWDLLRRHVVAPDGELLIVADPTQDLYERWGWADGDLSIEAGFTTPWIDLTGSYRMPPDLVPLANDFAALLPGDHLPGRVPDDRGEIVGPIAPTARHWRDVEKVSDLGVEIGREVVRVLRSHPSLDPQDVTFLCEYHHDGVAAVAEIEGAGYPVHHVFSRNPDDARRRRRYRFWPDADSVKGTTIHSFKGWESPVLVLGIAVEARSRRQAYLGLTRVKAVAPGAVSVLSVLNADRRLDHLRSSFEAWAPPPSTARVH